MKLIVGLGNPGPEYMKTRHNLGFIVLNYTLEKENIKFDKNKFDAMITIQGVGDDRVIFAEPTTYMNLSGTAVKQIMDFYKIKPNDLLVIYDDKDLEVGKIRIRKKGSSGGHNGIKDIINKIGTDEFNRLRIGIGSDKRIPTADYVLGKFTNEQYEIIKSNLDTYSDLVIDYINKDIKELQNKYK